MTLYIVLIEMKVVRNYVINNFKLEVDKIPLFCRKNHFWSTLEAPSEKTVHLQELLRGFKVVVNNIVDIIYFD